MENASGLSRGEVIRRLTLIGALKPGDQWPDFPQSDPNGWNWGPPLAALCARAAEILAADEMESIAHDQLNDIRWAADMRAIKRWQAAQPGKENFWPDHADLVVWLIEQLEARA